MRGENIFRIVGYLILYSICTTLYIFLHSQFYLIVLIIMTLGPIISLVMARILSKNISIEIIPNSISSKNRDGNNMWGKQHEEVYFCVKINNPTWCISLDAKLHLEISNSFFGYGALQIVSVPIRARQGYEFMLPLNSSLPGMVVVKATRVDLKDLTGFVFMKKAVDTQAEIAVMPAAMSDISYSKSDLDVGMLESEESNKKGNDFSDVQEIREYIPGDKLMSIHWKLSAKRDILMVKDRVSMSDQQLVIVPELYGKEEAALNMVVSATYTIISELISDKTSVRLIYWCKNRFDYECVRIDYKDQLDEAFARMFYESTYEGYDEAGSHMANVFPEISAYLYVHGEGGSLSIGVKENQ